MLQIKIPLAHFVAYLNNAKQRPTWPHLDEIAWLLASFKFSDTEVVYDPAPVAFTNWWTALAKN